MHIKWIKKVLFYDIVDTVLRVLLLLVKMVFFVFFLKMAISWLEKW